MMEHDFWLLEEKKVVYTDYVAYLPRKDAPAGFSDDFIYYIHDTLAWVPTLNPARADCPAGFGLNQFGPTIINQSGGTLFQQICLAWVHLLQFGPDTLRLQGMHPEDFEPYVPLFIEKKSCLQTLTQLAYFGEMAATGDYFILHIGV